MYAGVWRTIYCGRVDGLHLERLDEQQALSAVRRKMRGVGSQHLRACTKLAPTALDAGVELARIHWIQ